MRAKNAPTVPAEPQPIADVSEHLQVPVDELLRMASMNRIHMGVFASLEGSESLPLFWCFGSVIAQLRSEGSLQTSAMADRIAEWLASVEKRRPWMPPGFLELPPDGFYLIRHEYRRDPSTRFRVDWGMRFEGEWTREGLAKPVKFRVHDLLMHVGEARRLQRTRSRQLALEAHANVSGPHGSTKQAAPARPGPMWRWQEEEILAVLQGMGKDPMKLPPHPRGRHGGLKKECLAVLKQRDRSAWEGERFPKAWKRLLDDGRIAYAAIQ